MTSQNRQLTDCSFFKTIYIPPGQINLSMSKKAKQHALNAGLKNAQERQERARKVYSCLTDRWQTLLQLQEAVFNRYNVVFSTISIRSYCCDRRLKELLFGGEIYRKVNPLSFRID